MTHLSCNLYADNRQRCGALSFGVQYRLRRLHQARNFGRHVLPVDTLTRVSQERLAFAIGNARSFQMMTERVLQIMNTQLRKSRGRPLVFDFFCTAYEHAGPRYVRAVAGGVVSEARERYNALDS